MRVSLLTVRSPLRTVLPSAMALTSVDLPAPLTPSSPLQLEPARLGPHLEQADHGVVTRADERGPSRTALEVPGNLAQQLVQIASLAEQNIAIRLQPGQLAGLARRFHESEIER